MKKKNQDFFQVIYFKLIFFFQSHQRKAPPLPPVQAQSQIPPTPLNAPPVHRTLPSRPPPLPTAVTTSAPISPPPPPPPPMPQISNSAPPPPPMPSFENDDQGDRNKDNNDYKPAVPDARSMLMESIRGGISLKVRM